MSTIFFEVSKNLLSQFAISARDSSRDADYGIGGYVRNTDLSKAKQHLVTKEFLPRFGTLKPGASDAENLVLFHNAIEALRASAKSKALEYKYDEGSFGLKMMCALTFLRYFHAFMEEHDMLDLPHDKNPLHEFMYQAALYEGSKLAEYYSNMFSQHSQKNISVAIEKSQLVIGKVKDTRERVQSYSRERHGYERLVHKTVLEAVEAVIRQNKEICESHSHGAKVPVFSFSMFTASVQTPDVIGPGVGELESRMMEAKRIIGPEPAVQPEARIPHARVAPEEAYADQDYEAVLDQAEENRGGLKIDQ